MRRHEAEFAAHEAKLVFVGTGSPEQAARYAAHAGHHPVLSDAARAVFQRAGMHRGLLAWLRLRLLRNAWRAWRSGFRQSRVMGDALQLGGVLVFAADGRLLHAEAERTAGDPLDMAAVMAAISS